MVEVMRFASVSHGRNSGERGHCGHAPLCWGTMCGGHALQMMRIMFYHVLRACYFTYFYMHFWIKFGNVFVFWELFLGCSGKSCCASLFGMKLAGSGLLDTSYPPGWNWDSLGSWGTVERKVTF
jgi:hypothetical protein